MRASQNCSDLIKHFEGLRLDAYQCPSGVWTIGYGHTKGVREGDVVTQAVAEMMLEDDLLQFEHDVSSLVNRDPLQCEFDALVSFAFNVGSDIDADTTPEGLGDSTLMKKYNAGDIDGAAAEFLKWVKSRGVVLRGLERRRAAERALFLGQDWRAAARDD